MPMSSLQDFLKPGVPLPADDLMIAKALDILNHSPHGQQLADFARTGRVAIRVIGTPQPRAYLPDTRTACSLSS